MKEMKPKNENNNKGFAKNWQITRREFLRNSTLVMGGVTLGFISACSKKQGDKSKVRFVMATDLHYADTDPKGERFYRESLQKLNECVSLANDKNADFIIELGDFKDQNNPPAEKSTLTNLRTVETVFSKFNGPRYHVIGNHDTDSISKEQFLNIVENTEIRKEAKYYSFDVNKQHFIVLDANYNSDGSDYDHGNFDWKDANIPPDEIEWLVNDLAATSYSVIVFIHQQLDENGSHTVKNASVIRNILKESGKVLTVFQGHFHEGAYNKIDGIHYYTLKAMVTGSAEENNSYSLVEVLDNNNVIVNGYRKAESKRMFID